MDIVNFICQELVFWMSVIFRVYLRVMYVGFHRMRMTLDMECYDHLTHGVLFACVCVPTYTDSFYGHTWSASAMFNTAER